MESPDPDPKWQLDPEARAALGPKYPGPTWMLIQNQVFQAFDSHPEEAQKLVDRYQPPPPLDDPEGLDLALQNLDPVVGINNFQYLNEKVNLQDPLKSSPLDVLEEVMRMVTQSDKWQTEVVI